MNLDNLKDIAKIDTEDMLDLLVSFPGQCEDALFIGESTAVKNRYKRNYSSIIFTGLGGSAIGGDIVKGYIEGETGIPICVNRNYTLPRFAGKNSLVFAVSYSGNTEETLSAYTEAKKRNANTVVITSGGKIRELALKNNDILVALPKGYPPRCVLGYSFIPAIVMLTKLEIVKNKNLEIKEASRFLNILAKKSLLPGVKGRANISKTAARKIYGRFPVIYASSALESVTTRWRGQFAENAKTLSSSHVFPEMNHNEIVGWKDPASVLKKFTAIILRDSHDLTRIRKRMDITAAILKKSKFNVLEIKSEGKTFLERMLSLAYIGDFTSFYLSMLYGQDPTPVDRITYLKKQLGK